MQPLIDAAGNVVPTDTCSCGRPKLASKSQCCYTCRTGMHMTGCSIRSATMGVPGFGVEASPLPERTRYITVPGSRTTADRRFDRRNRPDQT